MLRQSITKGSGLAASTSRRALSTSVRLMAGGDTGAPSKYGAASSDAFQKREKANEDYAIRQREKEKLLELRKKLHEQQAHLKKLSDHIDEITKGQGGEHN
ncbi:mitochondrial ATPase inhibitor, IATP-domain-containing protein [Microdochium bolleyi]|uniref:ATPase inhibitor, mitochondrial n=1 Tax=Microdochium bolleyi TaxID=196109 RepID=A0A136JF20_9PEZI|nr:mitochondrial ATPase inhibitor, IATP-domain-containing protein [Microdochium bolleyi]